MPMVAARRSAIASPVMRPFLALLFATAAAFGAEDPLASLRFLDGKARTLEQFKGQAVVVVSFCGHCPSARQFIATEAVALADLIEKERLPARLVCATPEHAGPDLEAYIKDAAPSLADRALFANDPVNAQKIGLSNILQNAAFDAGGKQRPTGGLRNLAASVTPLLRAAKGRYPVDGLTGKALEAWWLMEMGRPGAVKGAVTAAKKDAEVAKALAPVETAIRARLDALVAAPVELATYESLEALLEEGDGLDLKAGSERLKTLAKEPALKKELQARTAWKQVQAQLASSKPKEQEAGRANLAELAKRFPDTVYGRRAAATPAPGK